jgi:RHS repeat-associated protein
MIARRSISGGLVHYYFDDNLRSSTVVADNTGAIQKQYDYAPYGELHWQSGTDPNHYQSFGKEEDTEDGDKYFGARYYRGNMGRFLTPDWSSMTEPIPYARLDDPQSLNLYSYSGNSPLSNKDLDGHCVVDGETHGGVWCAFHILGFTSTAHENAEYYRNRYSNYNFYQNGRRINLQNLTDDQVNAMWLTFLKVDQDEIYWALSTQYETHHLLPQEFKTNFERAGLDIEDPDYKLPMSKEDHRLKPDGIHAQGSQGWNQQWRRFFADNPNASREQIVMQLEKMRDAFGLNR